MAETVGELPGKGAFSQAVHSTFRAAFDGHPEFTLRLTEFNDSSNAAQETFSLLFQAPVDAPEIQSIYRLENDDLGTIDLFLVPVRKDENGLYYEAVFNRFLNP